MCRFIIAIVIVWRFLLLSPLFAQYVHPFHATQSHDLQNTGVSFLLIPFMPDPQTNEPDISSVQIGLAFDMDKIRAPISKNDNFSKFLAFPPFSTEVVPSILESLRFGSPVHSKKTLDLVDQEVQRPHQNNRKHPDLDIPITRILAFLNAFPLVPSTNQMSIQPSLQAVDDLDGFREIDYFYEEVVPLVAGPWTANELRSLTSQQFVYKKLNSNVIQTAAVSTSWNYALQSFPDFSPVTGIYSDLPFDAFSDNHFEPSPSKESPEKTTNSSSRQYVKSSRQRRATYFFEWELSDFVDPSSNANDYFQFSNSDFNSSDTLNIRIKPIIGLANRDGNGTDLNSSATESLNTPKYLLDGHTYSYDPETGIQTGIAAGIWEDKEFTLMNISGGGPSSPPTINIDASAMKYYMNWYYGDWQLKDANGPSYSLMYYSAVPEPSTYFMTGALFCLLGFNQSSRNSIKRLFAKVFLRFLGKENGSNLKNWVS